MEVFLKKEFDDAGYNTEVFHDGILFIKDFLKDKELDTKIIAADKEISKINLIINWYQKFRELTKESENLNTKYDKLNPKQKLILKALENKGKIKLNRAYIELLYQNKFLN